MVSNLAAEMEELCKLYPQESWPVNEDICDEETTENTSTPSPCKDYSNVNIIVGETSEKTCPLSSGRTFGDDHSHFSPIDLADLARQQTHGKEDTRTNLSDSAHESRVTDGLIRTESEESLETGQVIENEGQAQETSNDVIGTIYPSDIEFVLVNTRFS